VLPQLREIKELGRLGSEVNGVPKQLRIVKEFERLGSDVI